MRSAFFEELKKEMKRDESLFLLISDTGFNLVEPFFEEFPQRTLNVGIAEQNLIGIAAGLCNIGFRPICYAISNFLIYRCLEQIRNDICLHNYKVVLVGTGTGFDYGGLGPTHHVVDEIGCLKSLPNIEIYSPSGVQSMRKVFQEIVQSSKPAYVRIAKSSFSEEREPINLSRFIFQDNNSKVLVITHGKMVKNVTEAVKLFPCFSIFAMDKIKPLDELSLKDLFRHYTKIVIVEDNVKEAGLYDSICRYVIENKIGVRDLYSINTRGGYEQFIGDAAYLEDKHGLSPEKISKFIQNLI
ncbi:MAG: transketolase [Microgenomates group bacterium Gr01-1014_93]|nr:MAG: transketolase [Microgenomates group bacterium Gr01-1014_93]